MCTSVYVGIGVDALHDAGVLHHSGVAYVCLNAAPILVVPLRHLLNLFTKM